MELPTRAAALRQSLERAVGSDAVVTEVAPGRVRIAITIPVDIDVARWRTALHVVQTAADWGSSDSFGGLTVWAEVDLEGVTS